MPWNIIIPVAVELLKKYIDSTSSTKDDKVLEVVQSGAEYLAIKHNNTVSTQIAQPLKNCTMKNIQG
ncbi:MAG: hypothetical protein RBR07_04810 [Arcobacteraceae bacterium]|nr:hypothetical protein [Arcobacteraceae bacterium]